MEAGHQLRIWREQLGYTIRDVEAASQRIAAHRSNEDFAIPLSRLSDIETKGVVPSVFRLYTLSVIYRHSFNEVLGLFGLNLDTYAADMLLAEPPRSHRLGHELPQSTAQIPVALDPAFDPRTTANLGRMIQGWGFMPLAVIAQLAPEKYTYGYIGSEDFSMYPLLVPGSFVQVDESKNKVQGGIWRSEYERPIYFVETRDGYTCCWCSVNGSRLILQPHPLSPTAPRALKQPQEAEVLGQVVAVAMRLGEWTSPALAPMRSGREPSN